MRANVLQLDDAGKKKSVKHFWVGKGFFREGGILIFLWSLIF